MTRPTNQDESIAERRARGLYWDRAFSVVEGCTHVSAECANCWSATASAMRSRQKNAVAKRYAGLTKGNAFNGTVRFQSQDLNKPLHVRKPVVWAVWNDLFHEGITDGQIMDAWRVMAMAPVGNRFLVLTKRAKRMRAWCERWADWKEADREPRLARGPDEIRAKHTCGRALLWADMLDGWGKPPPGCAFPTYDWMEGPAVWPTALHNVWLGVTAGTQASADERIPHLLATPAAHRFVSVEPMLEPIEMLGKPARPDGVKTAIDWLILGCESGPHRRPYPEDAARSLIEQCQAAGVPVWHKQMPVNGRVSHDPQEWPEWARVRQLPWVEHA